MTAIAATALGVTWLGAPALAQEGEEKPVTATLIADKTSAAPGEKVTLGVRLQIAPHWHVYWRNPGETGFATEVQWAGPAGPLADAATLYPAPISFISPGDLKSFGYEEETLLLTEVQVPADAKEEITFSAKPKWLMCSDRCIPGRAALELKLKVGKSEPANQELFDKYRARLPKKLEAGKLPAGLTAKLKPAKDGVEVVVTADPAGGRIVGEDRVKDGLSALALYPFVEKKSGLVPGVPQIPAPDGKAATPAGDIKVYTKPTDLSVKVEQGDTAKPPPASVTAVLVVQRLAADGKPQPAELAEVEIK